MTTLQFEVSDDLAQDVIPYREHLSDLLALGLRVWKRREENDTTDELDRLLGKLGDENKLILPKQNSVEQASIPRMTPLNIPGSPVSDVVIAQRSA